MRNAFVMLARGIRRRCPRCGGVDLFTGYFKMRTSCPTCGLAFERGDSAGHFLGGMMLNLVVTELAFGTTLLAGILLTWPDVPWTTLLVISVVVNVTVPVAFYPVALTIWSAFELLLFRMDEASIPLATYERDLEVPGDL